jgi:hypothetical protein
MRIYEIGIYIYKFKVSKGYYYLKNLRIEINKFRNNIKFDRDED